MTWLRETRWRGLLIACGICVLAAAHWIAPTTKSVHNVLFHLDIIPILFAGMLFGARAAVGTTAVIAAVELPQVWQKWPQDLVYVLDQVGELAVFGVAGAVVGTLAERRRKTIVELESVYTELRENVEKLTKAERLSAVAQLSASLAHEIRNPLAGISGAAGILRRSNTSAENLRECVEIIERESQRLNKLLTNFLQFARPRTPRLQPTDLSAVIDSVVSLAAHSPGGSSVELRRILADGLPEVECDAEQLKQVLLNLVINSIEETPRGVVELRAAADDKWVTITVRDAGCGMSPQRQAHMFDPFFTTKDNGTGLGLAIASKIVEQHGGILRAANAPGQGMDMIVRLPLRRSVTA